MPGGDKQTPPVLFQEEPVYLGWVLKRMRFIYALVAAIPLLLAPALLFALAEGWLDFGGGEKDILLVFPYFIWALVFFLCGVILVIKHWPLGRWLKRSAVVSTVFIVILGAAAYAVSWLGIS